MPDIFLYVKIGPKLFDTFFHTDLELYLAYIQHNYSIQSIYLYLVYVYMYLWQHQLTYMYQYITGQVYSFISTPKIKELGWMVNKLVIILPQILRYDLFSYI